MYAGLAAADDVEHVFHDPAMDVRDDHQQGLFVFVWLCLFDCLFVLALITFP